MAFYIHYSPRVSAGRGRGGGLFSSSRDASRGGKPVAGRPQSTRHPQPGGEGVVQSRLPPSRGTAPRRAASPSRTSSSWSARRRSTKAARHEQMAGNLSQPGTHLARGSRMTTTAWGSGAEVLRSTPPRPPYHTALPKPAGEEPAQHNLAGEALSGP